jgi:hypothetical protein
VADKGFYIGMLYIGAIIEHSAFDTQVEEAKADGAGSNWGPTVDPAQLAALLWNMHSTQGRVPSQLPRRHLGSLTSP